MKVITVLITFAILVNCSSTQNRARMHYRLGDIEWKSDAQQLGGNVRIDQPKAMGILGNRPMVATNDQGALIQLDYNFWLDSPKKLIHKKLLEWAEKHYQSVIFDRTPHNNMTVIRTEILALEKRKDQAVLSLGFLINHEFKKFHFHKTYTHSITIEGNYYADFASAITQALVNILQELNKDIIQCCLPNKY